MIISKIWISISNTFHHAVSSLHTGLIIGGLNI